MVYIRSILFITILFTICSSCNKPIDPVKVKYHVDITQKADQALEYCIENNLNQEFCILVDMSIHSGKKRFFIYDFKHKQIVKRYLVSHGCGDNPWGSDYSKENPTFSNIPDSHCSSLGKYMIGKRGWSNWGVNINYRLHGLDASNSNANKRDVVFHSWSAISDQEVYPYGTPEGWGCPAISDNSFLELDELLRDLDTPALMWIFKS